MSLERYCEIWHSLWDDSDALQFAVTPSWLVDALVQEIECSDDRSKRAKELTFQFSTACEDFQKASAADRDAVAERVYNLRKEADTFQGWYTGNHVAIIPLVHALRLSNEDAIIKHANRILQSSPSPGYEPQKLVWLALVQFPYSLPVSRSPELIALRLLPDFCSGGANARNALSKYIQDMCESWISAIRNQNTNDWKSRYPSSPLKQIENGTWWARILLQPFSNKDSLDENESRIRAFAISECKSVCTPSVFKRECKEILQIDQTME